MDFGLLGRRDSEDRLETWTFGEGLTVRLASRWDQIHFKLYAPVDQGARKHKQDLRALTPTAAKLIEAALDVNS
jgi:hypothetical protein